MPQKWVLPSHLVNKRSQYTACITLSCHYCPNCNRSKFTPVKDVYAVTIVHPGVMWHSLRCEWKAAVLDLLTHSLILVTGSSTWHLGANIQGLSFEGRRTRAASIVAEVKGLGAQTLGAQTNRRTLHQISLPGVIPEGRCIFGPHFFVELVQFSHIGGFKVM